MLSTCHFASLRLYRIQSILLAGHLIPALSGPRHCLPAGLTLRSKVWEDADGNGVLDAGEYGLSGVTVQLLRGGSVVGVVVTDADGFFTFVNVAPGTYTPRVCPTSSDCSTRERTAPTTKLL
jgi:hypothetical protein